MDKNKIMKQIDNFERSLDKTIIDLKNLLKVIRQEVKNS